MFCFIQWGACGCQAVCIRGAWTLGSVSDVSLPRGSPSKCLVGTGDLRMLDNGGKHGLPPEDSSPSHGAGVRAAPLQRDQWTHREFPWEMLHPQTRGSSPGCGFQAGTSLSQVSRALHVSWSRRSQGTTGGRKAGAVVWTWVPLTSLGLSLLLCWVGVITLPASGGAVELQGMTCLLGLPSRCE